MKKSIFKAQLWAVILIAAVAFTACDNNLSGISDIDTSVNMKSSKISASAQNSVIAEMCGDASVTTLWAGQHHDAGTLTVSNNGENLYVTFDTSGDWLLKKTHMNVSTSLSGVPANRQGVPVPGHFAYSESHDHISSYTYVISLDDLNGELFTVAAHAEVVKLDEYGTVIRGETAWGGDQRGPSNRWWFYSVYEVQECTENPPLEVCYATDTAWSAGDRYVAQGNWATYTEYNGAEKSVTLFAGQTKNAGTVTFTPAGAGQVTITIDFNSGWGLQDVAESVKIQGYNNAPSGNPSPGSFTTYKGTSLSVTVPENNFFGVHIDAKSETDC